MDVTSIAVDPLDARTPTDPTEYDLDVVHPRLNDHGHCMSCGRAAREACEFPFDPSEIDFHDGDVTDYRLLIDVFFGGA